jgi:hypothetical protein
MKECTVVVSSIDYRFSSVIDGEPAPAEFGDAAANQQLCDLFLREHYFCFFFAGFFRFPCARL